MVEDGQRNTSSSSAVVGGLLNNGPNFIKEDTEEVARDFHIRKIIQIAFYAVVVNDAIELGILL